MGSRPVRAPGAWEEALARVPARVAKRVQDNPALAEAWAWAEDGRGVVAEGARVELGPAPVGVEGLRCDCLLAPRCVHVLAVLRALPEGGAAVVEVPPERPTVALSARQRAAAAQAWRTTERLLRHGAEGVGELGRGELARVGYAARDLGLHRLGRLAGRVVGGLRLLHARHAELDLARLVADLVELGLLSRRLGEERAEERWVGVGRRVYTPVGSLRLFGVACEPVVDPGGSAGVGTWLLDAAGGVWSVADVRPRAAGQVAGLYEAPPPLVTAPPRRLARAGLFVQGAVAAAIEAEGLAAEAREGAVAWRRLGTGGGGQAVLGGGAGLREGPVEALAGRPLRAQVEAGGLVAVDVTVVGVDGRGLVVEAEDGPLRLVPGVMAPGLPWRDNLVLLARAPGLRLRVVGRPDRARTLVALAATPLDAEGPLTLPEAWQGRCNLAFDRLHTGHLRRKAPTPATTSWPGRADPLGPLRRRVQRAALTGVGLSAAAARELGRAAAALRAGGMPEAARRLEGSGSAEGWVLAGLTLLGAEAAWERGGW